jgi:tetratricopeptide (TPR) repeat protein
MEQYRKAEQLQTRLVGDFPSVPAYRQELARTHNNLGIVYKRLKRREEADTSYRAALTLRQQLAKDFPEVVAYSIDEGSGYYNLGLAAYDADRVPEALTWFDQAVQKLSAVHQAHPTDPTAKRLLRNSIWARAGTFTKLNRHTESVSDWDMVISLSRPDERPEFQASRALALAKTGRIAEALAVLTELHSQQKWDGDQLYDFAVVYSIAAKMTAEKSVEYTETAVQFIDQAVKAGFKDVVRMKSDDDLHSLRDRDDFKKLVTDLEAEKTSKSEQAPAPTKKQ